MEGETQIVIKFLFSVSKGELLAIAGFSLSLYIYVSKSQEILKQN